MAIRPCRYCRARIQGPASRAYVAILNGGVRWEFKPHLCASCYSQLTHLFDQVGGLIDFDSDAAYEPQRCLVCHEFPDQKQPESVFLTGYPAAGDREDFFAPVCKPCRPRAERAIQGPSEAASAVLSRA